MAITLQSERQYPLTARVTFTYADLTDGSAELAVSMPTGAVVQSGYVHVTTAWDGGVGQTLDVGENDAGTPDPNRYTGTAIDLDAAATRVALDNTTEISGYQFTGSGGITLTYTSGGGSPTTGSAELVVTYIVADRGNEAQI